MLPIRTETETVPVAIVPGWAPVAITGRGTAYLRLAEFRDVWAGLGPTDRAYFASDLLVDAVVEGVPT